MPQLLAVALASLAGGTLGLFAGSVVGIAITSGPCPTFSLGYSGGGAILGAGVVAVSVLSRRPDPRACNRQDPPFPHG